MVAKEEMPGNGRKTGGFTRPGGRGKKAVFFRHDKQFSLSYRASLSRFSRLQKHLKVFIYAIVPGNDIIMSNLR